MSIDSVRYRYSISETDSVDDFVQSRRVEIRALCALKGLVENTETDTSALQTECALMGHVHVLTYTINNSLNRACFYCGAPMT